MTAKAYTYSYDQTYNPALPIVEIRLRATNRTSEERTLMAVVDSGADITIVPIDILEQLKARRIGQTDIRESTGLVRTMSVFAGDVRIGDLVVHSVRIAAARTGEEIILGRNVLNQLVVTLDGPGATTLIAA